MDGAATADEAACPEYFGQHRKLSRASIAFFQYRNVFWRSDAARAPPLDTNYIYIQLYTIPTYSSTASLRSNFQRS